MLQRALIVKAESALAFEENVAKTKQAAFEMNAMRRCSVVEGELSFIERLFDFTLFIDESARDTQCIGP